MLTALIVVAPARADVTYTYDDLGRIKTVRSASGEVAEYVYDSVGNIVDVRRVGAGELAVTGFTPNSGAVGTSATIDGSGFSATALDNSVAFNGVAASVTSASPNRLTAVVPAGALTGPIAVTVGANTATSRGAFTVVPGAGRLPPTIASFTPNIGAAGISVTVTGTNFDNAPGATRVELNGAQATSNVASETSLTMTVPPTAGSGPIRVSTAGGTAVSAADFIVPPPGVPQGSIVAFARANIGQTATLAINSQNSYGLLLVDGVQGTYASIDLPTFTVAPSTAVISYTVFGPNNTVFLSGKTVSATDRSIHLPPFPRNGTYTVAFFSGAATITLVAQPVAMTSVFSATARALSTTFVGQSIRVGYQGAANESPGLEIAGMSTGPAGQSVAVAMFKPDGTPFQSAAIGALGGFMQLPVLSMAGTYTIVVGPAGTATTSLQLTVEPGIPLTVNGASVSATTALAGESARYVYTAPATLPLEVRLNALQLGGSSASVTVYKADGTSIASTTCATAPCAIVVPNQTSTGPFSVVAQPSSGATGTLSISVVASDGAGALTPNNPVTISVPAGKKGYFTFAAAAGTSPSLRFTFAPSGGVFPFKILKPDGTELTTAHAQYNYTSGFFCNNSGASWPCWLALVNLPASGIYTVVMTPGVSVSITATLVPEAATTLNADTPATLSMVGEQNAVYRFNAAAGTSPSLRFTFAPPHPSGFSVVRFKIFKPDGTQLTTANAQYNYTQGFFCNYGSGSSFPCWLALVNLPASGTYTVVMTPPTNVSVSITATLVPEAATTLSPDTPATLSMVGEKNAVFRFNAAAGSSPSLRFTIAPAAPQYYTVRYKIFKPDGTEITSANTALNWTQGFFCNYSTSPSSPCHTQQLMNLPADGIYTVVMTPPTEVSVSITATLVPEVTGTLSAGTPLTLSGERNIAFRFNATAGTNPSLRFTFAPPLPTGDSRVFFRIIKPDGTELTLANVLNFPTALVCSYAPTTPCWAAMVGLPVSGIYTVVMAPSGNFNASITATLFPEATATLSGGTPATLTTTGQQSTAFLFNAAAGTSPSVSLAADTLYTTFVRVLKPDGTQLEASNLGVPLTWCNVSPSSACVVHLLSLPVSGTYAVVLTPQNGAVPSISVTGTLNPEAAATPTVGAPATATIDGLRQAAFRFNATAGTSPSVGFAFSPLPPAGTSDSLTVKVFKPDGAQLPAANFGVQIVRCYITNPSNPCALQLVNLPVGGTYTVVFTPQSATMPSINLTGTLYPEAAATLSAGTPVTVTTVGPQQAALRFSASSASSPNINLTLSPAPAGVSWYQVPWKSYKPDGTLLTSSTCYVMASPNNVCTIQLTNLPVSGLYNTVLTPNLPSNMPSTSITATLNGVPVPPAPNPFAAILPIIMELLLSD